MEDTLDPTLVLRRMAKHCPEEEQEGNREESRGPEGHRTRLDWGRGEAREMAQAKLAPRHGCTAAQRHGLRLFSLVASKRD